MTESLNALDKYKKVQESVKKHIHLLSTCNQDEVNIDTLVTFNSRLILSDCKAFLEAVKNEIGGEIIEDTEIGTFLYYEVAGN